MTKVGGKDASGEFYEEPTRSGLTRTAGVRPDEGSSETLPPPAGRSVPPASSPVPVIGARAASSSSMARRPTGQFPGFPKLRSEAALEAIASGVIAALGVERGTLALLVEPAYEPLGSALRRVAERAGLSIESHAVDPERLASEAFVGRLVSALHDVDGAIYLAPPGGVAPHLRAALFRSGGTRRDALLLGIDDRIVMHNLGSLSKELEAIAARLEAHCRKGKVMRVEGLGGTDLTIGTGTSVPWHHDVGRLDAPGLLVLPAGRSLFCPPNLSGTLAPDGGILLPGEELRAAAVRLRLHFEQGRLVGADGPLADRVLGAARAVPNGTMVGQVVFGTNPAVLTPVGHEGQDLTMPGLHLVLGDSRPEHTGAVFCASTSITVGVRRPDVSVDGDPVLVRGKFARSITA